MLHPQLVVFFAISSICTMILLIDFILISFGLLMESNTLRKLCNIALNFVIKTCPNRFLYDSIDLIGLA